MKNISLNKKCTIIVLNNVLNKGFCYSQGFLQLLLIFIGVFNYLVNDRWTFGKKAREQA